MANVIKKINRLTPSRDYEYFDIGTDSKFVDCNDNSLLIPIENLTLEKILPLKLKQETINNEATRIKSLDNIDEQGLYYISKTNIAGLPDNITSPFNLLVLTNGNSFKQILFKEERIYIRDNFSSAWSAALAKPFEGSNSSKAGTKGLVPAPKTTETGNFFLNANGKWTSLNNITFTSVGNNTPTFSNGFTSQGVVSITADDSTDGATKALSVTHGISAGSITVTGEGSFDSININNKASINNKGVGTFASISSIGDTPVTGEGSFNKISIKKKKSDGWTEIASIGDTGVGSFNSININNNQASISNIGAGTFFGGISVKKKESNGGETELASISNTGDGKFNNININDKASISNTGAGTFFGGISVKKKESNGNIKELASIDNIGKLVISNDENTSITEEGVTAGAAHIKGGLLVDKIIYGTGGVYNAVWNDLADSITVDKEAEIEAGYCYCLKDNKYIKSSKYLDNGIIGIHSDTYGFKMGNKIGEKQLDCAVAGFVLAYVDKDYLPGTALTCTKDGHLTKIKPKDKQRFPEKVIATYWKDEPAEEWGSDNRKIKVNGRKWVKIK